MNSRIRAWSTRAFYDPEPVLRALRQLERSLSGGTIPEAVLRLRTNNFKSEREARDAALFAHGMAKVCGVKVLVSPGETEDCDFLTRVRVEATEHFMCVQLKELAPGDLSPNQTLEPLVAKLQRLPPSDAVLAVHLNRRTTIPFEQLAAVRAPFAEVWFFWAADAALEQWCMFGDVMTSPQPYEFRYPS
jgi:hypothetical protein